MYAVACEMALAADMEEQEMEFAANELNQGAIVDSFSQSGYSANGLNVTLLWAEIG